MDHKEGWAPKNWCFLLVVLEKTPEISWTARRANQSILKKIIPEYSLDNWCKFRKLSSGHSFHSNPKERQCQRLFKFSSVQSFSCVWSSDPMDCSMPGFPVHHQIPEFTQTHVHWVDDAIQPFHPLSSPSDPTFKLSQYQGLFKWLSSSHQVAKVLEFQFQHQSFHRIFKPLHICTHLTH